MLGHRPYHIKRALGALCEDTGRITSSEHWELYVRTRGVSHQASAGSSMLGHRPYHIKRALGALCEDTGCITSSEHWELYVRT
ncbi:hypothetical protein NDU88_000144 [Pleurodeles waltl]|uniref:Uncharacterized protein n=1 Tax=Pleurodeles waltl TaxID=8319 RepID=A0AAV7MIV4_PLEWA|nr:hypothetical protein NDU88_000144 [Pleurodeles waltl]